MVAPQNKTDSPDVETTPPVALSEKIGGKESGFAGELQNIQLDSLIQLYCLSAETITIKIIQDDYTGKVFLENGEIVHAEGGPRSGEEAFFTIMALQGGRIETSQMEKAEKRTIHKNYQFLLMEVARLCDENGWIEEEHKTPDDASMARDGSRALAEEKKLKALVVDDSLFMRKIIAGMLTAEGDIEIIGMAANGKEALEKITTVKPDVITLDANMPVMDGLTTLKHIMIRKPCPVIVMSSLASGDQTSLTQFFTLGAVDFLPKPVKDNNILVQQQILTRARSAAQANIQNFKRLPFPPTVDPVQQTPAENGRQPLVVFVSGLGGYHEMLHVLSSLPAGLNFYLVAFQSLPEEFTHPFSSCAGKISQLPMRPADSKRDLEPGHCYIASLESHIVFKKSKTGYCLVTDATSCSRYDRGKSMNGFIRTAVDNFPGDVHGVFLSGTAGIEQASVEAIRDKKGKIIAQAPSSCMMSTFLEELTDKKLADTVVLPGAIAGEVLKLK